MLFTTHTPVDVDNVSGFVLQNEPNPPSIVVQLAGRANLHIALHEVDSFVGQIRELEAEAREFTSPPF